MKLERAINLYLRHLKAAGRSVYTLKGARYGLKSLLLFLENEKVGHIEDLNRDILAAYQEDLAFRLTARGTPLGRCAREKLIGVAKGFARFLKQREYLIHDPGESLKPPKRGRRLPRSILSVAEVGQLIKSVDRRTNTGVRDRLVLEILYDTGIRRAEAAGIRLADLDLEGGYVRIHGKGDKERVVPVSQRLCDLIRTYIIGVRPAFVKNRDSGHLILNRSGHKMAANGIYIIVKRCARIAGIKKNVTTHTFRHTCATHMLKNGAPVRHIQEMLGHESLESTQVYTRVTINDLKEIHARFHPSEKLKDTRR
ncbi:MAG: tyrosine-type recombinase/integrase [Desulfobacterales bacterium]